MIVSVQIDDHRVHEELPVGDHLWKAFDVSPCLCVPGTELMVKDRSFSSFCKREGKIKASGAFDNVDAVARVEARKGPIVDEGVSRRVFGIG